jgi:hypothetical protein
MMTPRKARPSRDLKLKVLLLVIAGAVGACACSPAQEGRAQMKDPQANFATPGAAHEPETERPPLTDTERQFYRDAAALAWSFMETNYQPATGLVNATPSWQYITTWDIGAQLIAFTAARELGLLEQAEFDRRMARTLSTLERVALFRGIAYNKAYSTRDASMGTGAGANRGTGWSATDLGRLLIGLKVVAEREPQHAAQAERVVRRIRFNEVVNDGYLHGQLIGRSGRPWTFQEGRIGYEQYIAAGFNLWGVRAQHALDLRRNAQPVTVLGVQLLQDRRWQDRLVSEPFVLYGLELGMPADVQQLATNILAAQAARFRATGQITIASEDAVGVPPYYFYYYCVYCNRKQFIIDAAQPGRDLDSPRWVSTKAAFGWHALMPDAYTQQALDHVAAARHRTNGWASGVFEGTGRSTDTYDINTAAVLLEVAAFQLRGARPLLQPAR